MFRCNRRMCSEHRRLWPAGNLSFGIWQLLVRLSTWIHRRRTHLLR